MALTALESDTISKGLMCAKTLIEKVKPAVDALDVIYNGAGNVKNSLTQENLNTVASLSGITKQQVDDIMFALTSSIKTDLFNAQTALTEAAARTSVGLPQ